MPHYGIVPEPVAGVGDGIAEGLATGVEMAFGVGSKVGLATTTWGICESSRKILD